MAKNTYRLFGVAPAAAAGARISADLVARASANDCTDVCARHNGLVRVSGNVVATIRNGAALTPQLPQSDSQISAAPYAKLQISTREGLGRILIDTDSSIVLPGRTVCGVEVLAPQSWGEPAPGQTLTGIVWDVHGAIQICPVTGGSVPLGRLTEFVQVASGAQVTFVRPRGARSVEFFTQPVVQFWELWAGAPGVGLQVGTVIVPVGGNGLVVQLAGVTHIRNMPFVAATTDIGMVWEINAL